MVAPAMFADSTPTALLQTLLEVSLTGTIFFRPIYAPDQPTKICDLAYVHLNPAAQRMLRLPACPAQSFLTLYPHADKTGVFAFYRDTFSSGGVGHHQVNYQWDGLDNYFYLVARRSDGLLVVSFSDTADQERSAVERTLRASQAQEQAARAKAEAQRGELQRVFEQAPIAICLFQGPEFVVELANPALDAIWGQSAATLLGQPFFRAMPTAAGQGLEAVLTRVLATGEPCTLREVPVILDRAHTGLPAQGYFSFVFQPLRNAQGQPTGIFVAGTEVTEQVQARHLVEQLNHELEARVTERAQQLAAALEEAQQQRANVLAQQQLLRQILQQVPAAIATFAGPAHELTFYNETYQALVGKPVALAQPAAVLFPEVVEQGFLALLNEVYTTGQPIVGTEVAARFLAAATRPHYLDFTYQALLSKDGQPTGVLASVIDVTEKVLVRQQVQQLNEELAASNEALRATNEALGHTNQQLTRTNADLDNFIYTASHDLKEPITNLGGLVQALQEQLPAEAYQAKLVPRLLEMITGAIARFQLTVAQLTDISQLQQAYALPTETIDLAGLIEAVRLDLAPTLAAAGARLTVEVAACPYLSFSAKNLRSIVYNLLSNAVKYRHPARRPQVQVRSYRAAAAAVLEVQDNGLGLSEVQQAQLFGMFQRLHDHVEGSGVGLYMVKKIVENAGGTITVESQLGAGTTFRVSLPDPAGEL